MKKNNNRLYVILAVVALLGLSWYQILNNATTLQEQYDGYLAEAREKSELGVRGDALQAYESAIEMHDSIELRKEVAEFYRKHYKEGDWEEYCLQIVDVFPKEGLAYEILMDCYYTMGDYAMCYDYYREAEKKHITTKSMEEKYNSMYYKVQELSSYEDAKDFSGGLCAVTAATTEPAKWGFVDSTGAMTVGEAFYDVSGFTNAGYAAVKKEVPNPEGDEPTYEYVIIDTSGEIKYADPKRGDRTITDMGLYSSDKIAAQINGKYCYMDIEFNSLYGNFDYATTYAGDIAVVKNGDKWIIINENGDQIGSETFDDVKLDRTLIAFRNGVAFAQKNGKYYLVDTTGKVICDTAFEDADAFASEGYAAVKYEGAWGFVDTSGNFIIKPQYMYAKSFTNGLAAVSDGTEWVYISEDNDIVIRGSGGETEEENEKYIYKEARQFSDDGSAFVKVNGEWVQILLYRQALSD